MYIIELLLKVNRSLKVVRPLLVRTSVYFDWVLIPKTRLVPCPNNPLLVRIFITKIDWNTKPSVSADFT